MMDMASERVLGVLSDPTHPDLHASLRHAARAISTCSESDFRLWLQGGLDTQLLHILHSIPTLDLDPAAAANLCAAAAAVMTNAILMAKRHGGGLPSVTTSLTATIRSPQTLQAVIDHGMLGPAAMQPLSTCARLHMEVGAAHAAAVRAATGEVVRFSEGFWTPLRVCGFLLDAVFSAEARTCAVMQRLTLFHLMDTDVFRHLLLTALEMPCGMPWVVIVLASGWNAASGFYCVQPLMPELVLALQTLREGWESAPPDMRAAQAGLCEAWTLGLLGFTQRFANNVLTVTLLKGWLTRLIYTVLRWIFGADWVREVETSRLTFNLEIMTAALDFALAWQQARAPSVAPGGGNACDVPLLQDVTSTFRPLAVQVTEWEEAKWELLEPMLEQGMLLRWLRGLHLMGPAAALRCLVVALYLLDVFWAEDAAGGPQTGARSPGDQRLAVAFLEGLLLPEALLGLRACIQSDPSLVMGAAMRLVAKAVARSGRYMHSPSQGVLAAISLMLRDISPHFGVSNSGIEALPPPAAEVAAGEGPHATSSLRLTQDLLLPLLCTSAGTLAWPDVEPFLARLVELLAASKAAPQHQDAQQTEAAISRCLLSIGDCIAERPDPRAPALMWNAVAVVAGMHDVTGEHLARRYSELQKDRETLMAPGSGANQPPSLPQHAPPPSPARLLGTAEIAALLLSLQLLSHQDPGCWWSHIQPVLCAYLATSDADMNRAAEEVILAGIAHSTKERAFGSCPGDVEAVVAKLLHCMANADGMYCVANAQCQLAESRLRQPYCFTPADLQDSEPAVMDLWLVGAVLSLGGVQPWAALGLGYVHHSEGWRCLKAWSLEYAERAGPGSHGGGRLEGRRALRLQCVKAFAKFVAGGAGVPSADQVAFCKQWLVQLQGAEGSAGLRGGSSTQHAEVRSAAVHPEAAAAAVVSSCPSASAGSAPASRPAGRGPAAATQQLATAGGTAAAAVAAAEVAAVAASGAGSAGGSQAAGSAPPSALAADQGAAVLPAASTSTLPATVWQQAAAPAARETVTAVWTQGRALMAGTQASIHGAPAHDSVGGSSSAATSGSSSSSSSAATNGSSSSSSSSSVSGLVSSSGSEPFVIGSNGGATGAHDQGAAMRATARRKPPSEAAASSMNTRRGVGLAALGSGLPGQGSGSVALGMAAAAGPPLSMPLTGGEAGAQQLPPASTSAWTLQGASVASLAAAPCQPASVAPAEPAVGRSKDAAAAAAGTAAAAAATAAAASTASATGPSSSSSRLAGGPSSTRNLAAACSSQQAAAPPVPLPTVSDRQCANCDGQHEELLVCSGCMGVKYCSAKCQKAHWRRHRKECKQAQREQRAALLQVSTAAEASAAATE